jgi:hypothetical protein
VLRVCSPPTTNGRYTDGNSPAALERVAEARRLQIVHESLIG